MPIAAFRKKPVRGPFRSLARIIGASAAVILALQAAGPASAQPGDAAQRRFAQSYVGAIRSQDSGRVAAILHPATRACINDQDRYFFDYLFNQQLSTGAELTAAYEIEHIQPVTGPAELMMLPPEGFAYPVAPTHLMQLNAKGKDGKIYIVIAYLAPANGGWFVVTPCPNAVGVKMIAEQQAKVRAQGGAR
jgi:hypothetical protein